MSNTFIRYLRWFSYHLLYLLRRHLLKLFLYILLYLSCWNIICLYRLCLWFLVNNLILFFILLLTRNCTFNKELLIFNLILWYYGMNFFLLFLFVNLCRHIINFNCHFVVFILMFFVFIKIMLLCLCVNIIYCRITLWAIIVLINLFNIKSNDSNGILTFF